MISDSPKGDDNKMVEMKKKPDLKKTEPKKADIKKVEPKKAAVSKSAVKPSVKSRK